MPCLMILLLTMYFFYPQTLLEQNNQTVEHVLSQQTELEIQLQQSQAENAELKMQLEGLREGTGEKSAEDRTFEIEGKLRMLQ